MSLYIKINIYLKDGFSYREEDGWLINHLVYIITYNKREEHTCYLIFLPEENKHTLENFYVSKFY